MIQLDKINSKIFDRKKGFKFIGIEKSDNLCSSETLYCINVLVKKYF